MKQALHIFKKDVRHLWFEITVALSVVAGFAFTFAREALWLVDPGTNRVAASTLLTFLLPLTWWMLIARVIHDEVLPGDRQFWTTRPYAWKSLLGAKALFILTFINLPMLAADALIVHAYGLSVGSELPGLLWSQLLLTAAFILPIATLSALTTGFVQLIFAILIPCVTAMVVAIAAPNAVLGGLLDGTEWVKSYYALGVIAASALAILMWQYSRRRTTAARFSAVVAGIFAVAGMALIPWSTAFGVQSWFSKQQLSQTPVFVDWDSANKPTVSAVAGGDGQVRVTLPLQVQGLGPGVSAKPEGFVLRVQAPDGTTWETDQRPLRGSRDVGQRFSLPMSVDGAVYRRVKSLPLKIRGTLYLTIFGNRQTVGVPFESGSISVPGVGVCSASGGVSGQPHLLICYSAFRFPRALVSYHFLQTAKDGTQEMDSHTQLRPISYSPFPAEVGIDPMNQDLTFSLARGPVSEAAVDTLEPLAYVEREFEINDLRLEDFEASGGPALP